MAYTPEVRESLEGLMQMCENIYMDRHTERKMITAHCMALVENRVAVPEVVMQALVELAIPIPAIPVPSLQKDWTNA